MPLLRALPIRWFLVLCAGLGLAFCGQGAGLWSNEGEAAAATPTREAEKPVAIERVDDSRSVATPREADSDATRAAAEADRNGAIAALDQDRRARIEQLTASLRSGSYHAAVAAMQELDAASDDATAAALRATAAANGWPELVGTVRDSLPWTPSEFSLKGRLVRMSADAAACRVVAHDRDGATMRMLTKQGVTFPKVRAHELEPDSVRADEAVELGFLAYGAADYRSARIWCAIAIARSSGPSDRLAQLQNCLR